eukprot:GSA25T00007378001.1
MTPAQMKMAARNPLYHLAAPQQEMLTKEQVHDDIFEALLVEDDDRLEEASKGATTVVEHAKQFMEQKGERLGPDSLYDTTFMETVNR